MHLLLEWYPIGPKPIRDHELIDLQQRIPLHLRRESRGVFDERRKLFVRDGVEVDSVQSEARIAALMRDLLALVLKIEKGFSELVFGHSSPPNTISTSMRRNENVPVEVNPHRGKHATVHELSIVVLNRFALFFCQLSHGDSCPAMRWAPSILQPVIQPGYRPCGGVESRAGSAQKTRGAHHTNHPAASAETLGFFRWISGPAFGNRPNGSSGRADANRGTSRMWLWGRAS
jgi:hypothetical protein